MGVQHATGASVREATPADGTDVDAAAGGAAPGGAAAGGAAPGGAMLADVPPGGATPGGVTGNRLSQWVDRTPDMSQVAATPSAGEDMALIYDPRQHRVLLFGGKDDESTNVNETWAMDLATKSWQEIEVAPAPPAVEDHSLVYDPVGHRMILYGGEDGASWNNTWSFDLQNHVWRDITDPGAPRREDHTAIYDRRGKRMVVFGGQDNNEVDGAIWALDLAPDSPRFEEWEVLTVQGATPPARYDHVAAYDSVENRMVLFGGWDPVDKRFLNDTWAFSFDASRWEEITARARPSGRRHAVSTLDTGRSWMIIYGGLDANGYVNDVWAFDFAADGWLNITPGPQPRIDHAVVFDPRSRSLLLYGGDANTKGKFHDLWELEIQPGLPLHILLFQAGAKFPQRDKASRSTGN